MMELRQDHECEYCGVNYAHTCNGHFIQDYSNRLQVLNALKEKQIIIDEAKKLIEKLEKFDSNVNGKWSGYELMDAYGLNWLKKARKWLEKYGEEK